MMSFDSDIILLLSTCPVGRYVSDRKKSFEYVMNHDIILVSPRTWKSVNVR